ncbi:hypothetical protein CRENBAI_019643 [Crenichthys baileyi]|uniref:Xaa-Pro aminopeptidase 2 n=1 Tax=Crenichthys baileyi TaxID=28760 RepID=A0AAV9RIP6_9TELE
MPSMWLWTLSVAVLTGNLCSAAAYERTERNCSLTPPYLPSTAVNTTLQLQELRERMLPLNISAYIIPGTDAHLSEYIAPRDARMAFMTGFTGSAGTAVVTQTKAALWTDSRYWVQAERQMDCNWELEKDVSIMSVSEWLISQVPPGGNIGFDPFLFSLKTQEGYAMSLESSNRILKSFPVNLVDQVWKDRPPVPPDNLTRLPDRVIQRTWQMKPEAKVWIGTEYTNYALYEIITPQEKLMTSSYSPVLTTKAVKDETEERILREAHVRDAVAVIQLLMWLEKAVPKGNLTELSAAEYVNNCRSKQKDNRGPSFETISASGPNAALAHYSPSEETSRRLTVDEMYLVDSGGQYLDGTTDITRTVHWGTPTDMQKEAFTRVLMGNIEISQTVFPSGTSGVRIEMLGRRALWEVGLNYGHGTGHGVGNYFGVHEWPVGFQNNNIPFKAGMFTSIEPGYYKENDFGIRIEDIAVTIPVHTKYGHNFLTFDTVSLVPYDRKLVDTLLLSSKQLQWLNNYYEKIRQLLGPELDKQGLHEEKDWMLRNTEPFTKAGSSASVSSSSLTLIALVFALHNIV